MAALAAEAAEERPRAAMIAAPRLPTVGRNVSRFHASSLIMALSGLPLALAKRYSAYIVGEWLPHTTSFSIASTGWPLFCASCDSARLWSSRSMAVKFLRGSDGADFIAIKALVLAGLPTTSTLT